MSLAKGIFIARCLPCLKSNTSKFSIRRMGFDKHLNMYFPEHEIVYAYDPQKVCKSGDFALIEELTDKLTRLLTHRVIEVVFPCGDVTDPITGKKLSCGDYRDDLEEINKLYGKGSDSFDYNSSVPRGWQENKKDYSHGVSYSKDNKYDDSPFAV